VLCLTAVPFGFGTFASALHTANDALGPHLGWALPVGTACLIVGLTKLFKHNCLLKWA
jgi:hypothetical protein